MACKEIGKCKALLSHVYEEREMSYVSCMLNVHVHLDLVIATNQELVRGSDVCM